VTQGCVRLCAPDSYASVPFHMAPPGEQSSWKALGELSSLGFAMVLATIIGLGGGYYADRWLGTSPWLTLIGLVLGIVSGFVILFRSVKAAERALDEDHD
jgi:ATP synthase protein I